MLLSGVDLYDQFLAAAASRHHRVKKWYLAIFLRSLDWVACNVCIMKREASTVVGRKTLTNRLVKRRMVQGLMRIASTMKTVTSVLPPGEEEEEDEADSAPVCHRRFSKEQHLVVRGVVREDCVMHCREDRHRSFYKCLTCQVHLCVDGCFFTFHRRNVYSEDPREQKYVCSHAGKVPPLAE